MIPILRAITLFDQEIRNVSLSQHSAIVLEVTTFIERRDSAYASTIPYSTADTD